MPKASIIVPVYNVEKYLRQCLDSIINQTLHDIEIIIVNDGSTDGCPAIIKEYSAADPRILVIDKPNAGYGHSVNIGIAASTAEYIGIIEPDDWIEPDMYEYLIALAEQYDLDVAKGPLTFFDHITGADSNMQMFPEEYVGKVIKPLEYPDIFYYNNCIWSGIYRRDFILRNKLRLLESPGASYQDISFNFKILALAERLLAINKTMVHYRKNHGTNSVASTEKIFCVCDEYREIYRWLAQKPELADIIRPIYIRCKYSMYAWNYGRLQNSPQNQALFKERFRREFRDLIELIRLFETVIVQLQKNGGKMITDF
ncbi:MAG: glycosyltransferase [Rickettsiales bacterium]|jgi:glycosyltransferase involved in cell wall biosynthesis|nr:glycosyltransferase [Rickettsiales bacterium]